MTNESANDPHYSMLLLLPLPVTCVIGNAMVVAAVLTHKTLKNCTNFLLVSLAAADMSIGLLVMPFAIYLAANNLQWHIGTFLCNVWVVMDVVVSTASIVNLMLIALDRLLAVVRHTEYQTRVHRKRVYGAIVLCWAFSIGIGLPLGMGLNRGNEARLDFSVDFYCGIESPQYMLYGSIFSFFIPCSVMISTYGYIFYALRRRMLAVRLQEMSAGKFIAFSMDVNNTAQTAIAGHKSNEGWEKPLIDQLQNAVEENESEIEEMSDDDRKQLTTILDAVKEYQAANVTVTVHQNKKKDKRSGSSLTQALQTFSTPAAINVKYEYVEDDENNTLHDRTKEARRKLLSLRGTVTNNTAVVKQVDRKFSEMSYHEVLRPPPKYTGKFKDWALEVVTKLKSKQGMAIRREKRATKLVSIVMFVFLLFWLPFFSLNMYRVYCHYYSNWSETLETMFQIATWLGYMNSCMNPFIYAMINIKFRNAFRDIIHCRYGKNLARREKGFTKKSKLYNTSLRNNVINNKPDGMRKPNRRMKRGQSENHGTRTGKLVAFKQRFQTLIKRPTEEKSRSPTRELDSTNEKPSCNLVATPPSHIHPSSSDNQLEDNVVYL